MLLSEKEARPNNLTWIVTAMNGGSYSTDLAQRTRLHQVKERPAHTGNWDEDNP